MLLVHLNPVIMRRFVIFTLVYIMFVNVINAQFFTGINNRHVSPELKKTTLLVIKYQSEDTLDVIFNNAFVDKQEQQSFHNKINKSIEKLNGQLEKIFSKYDYKVKFINEEDLENHDINEYRFVFNRYLVRQSSIKNPKKGYFTYTHYFKDRLTNKAYRDIELYSNNSMFVNKTIIKELNDYLATTELVVNVDEDVSDVENSENELSEEIQPRYIKDEKNVEMED